MVVALLVLILLVLVAVFASQPDVVSWWRALWSEAALERRVEPPLTQDEARYLAAVGKVDEFRWLVAEAGWDVALVSLRVETAAMAAATERWAHLAVPAESAEA